MTTQNTTAQVQRALAALGFDPGPVDGIPGARTTAAVKAYQTSRGLVRDGVVGPATLRALTADGWVIVERTAPTGGGFVNVARSTSSLTPWMDEARRYLGVREVAGPKHSPTILDWLRNIGGARLGANITDDESPWCGVFVAQCILRALPGEPLPPIVVRAASWATFGVRLSEPCPGAIMVWKRPGGHHVGFYDAEDPRAYHVLGGNQSNAVNIMRMGKDRELVAIRWPATVPLPTSGRLMRSGVGDLSQNEA